MDFVSSLKDFLGVSSSQYDLVIIIFSAESLVGALNGIKICYSIIVPSIFPLTVVSLMLYESKEI